MSDTKKIRKNNYFDRLKFEIRPMIEKKFGSAYNIKPETFFNLIMVEFGFTAKTTRKWMDIFIDTKLIEFTDKGLVSFINDFNGER
jgi:hypothetical protein